MIATTTLFTTPTPTILLSNCLNQSNSNLFSLVNKQARELVNTSTTSGTPAALKRRAPTSSKKQKKSRTTPTTQDNEDMELAKLEKKLHLERMKIAIRKEAAEVRKLELSNLEHSRGLGVEKITDGLGEGFEDYKNVLTLEILEEDLGEDETGDFLH